MDRVAGAQIAFAAGEVSGDLLAGLVLPELRRRLPTASFAGIGGDQMTAAGCVPWWHVRELSVRGYAEVLRHLPRLLRLRAQLVQRVLDWPAQVFVGVDAPDFNLGVEAKVRRRGVRTVHFIGPSIWAWRPKRMERIRAAVDRMLLTFPFEQRLYDAAGVRATYVGHPLASTIPLEPDAPAARLRLGLVSSPSPSSAPIALTTPVVAVLPGSRTAEIETLGPAFLATAALLQKRDTTLRCVVPAASAALLERLRVLAAAAGVDAERTMLLAGRSHDALEAADVVLVAGGTATLEAMLFKRPMVIAYRVPALTEWITLRQAIIPYFGLPNILAGRFTVPEFLQEAVNAGNLTAALLRYLDDAAAAGRLREQFHARHEELRRDTAGLTAQAIVDTLHSRA